MLGLVDDLRDHPFAMFVAEDVPAVISSDDPGFWGAQGVSYDWYAALLVAGELCGGIGLLKQLALNSIAFSLVDEAERARLAAAWETKWEAYVGWLATQQVE